MRMVADMLVIGAIMINTDKVTTLGKKVGTNTSVGGGMANGTDEAPLFLVQIQNGQVTNTSVSTRMTSSTDKALTLMRLATITLVSSKMASSMEKA